MRAHSLNYMGPQNNLLIFEGLRQIIQYKEFTECYELKQARRVNGARSGFNCITTCHNTNQPSRPDSWGRWLWLTHTWDLEMESALVLSIYFKNEDLSNSDLKDSHIADVHPNATHAHEIDKDVDHDRQICTWITLPKIVSKITVKNLYKPS